MRVTVKTGLITAGVWIAIKMFMFFTGLLGTYVVPMVMLNILGVLLAVAIGLYLHKRSTGEESNLLTDVKNGLASGLTYAMAISIFLYFYYDQIDPDFNAHQIAEFETGLKKELADPVKFQEIKNSNPEFEVKSKEEIFDSIMQGPRSFYKPGSTMAITMLSLLLLSTLNSIFVSFVFRKVMFKQS